MEEVDGHTLHMIDIFPEAGGSLSLRKRGDYGEERAFDGAALLAVTDPESFDVMLSWNTRVLRNPVHYDIWLGILPRETDLSEENLHHKASNGYFCSPLRMKLYLNGDKVDTGGNDEFNQALTTALRMRYQVVGDLVNLTFTCSKEGFTDRAFTAEHYNKHSTIKHADYRPCVLMRGPGVTVQVAGTLGAP